MIKKVNSFKHLFWFLDKKNLDRDKDKNLIIHQVLSQGTMDDVRKLFAVYGRETIKREFQKPRPGLYYLNILRFFQHILKIKKIDKRKYLKNIYEASHDNIR